LDRAEVTERADSEPVVAKLVRWEAHGATWNVVLLTEKLAVVDLCTCHGEPVDRIRSSDPALLRYLAGRSRSASDRRA
jgi:hypothetical protein